MIMQRYSSSFFIDDAEHMNPNSNSNEEKEVDPSLPFQQNITALQLLGRQQQHDLLFNNSSMLLPFLQQGNAINQNTLPASSTPRNVAVAETSPRSTSIINNVNAIGSTSSNNSSPIPIRNDGVSLQVVETMPPYSDNRLLNNRDMILDCLGPLMLGQQQVRRRHRRRTSYDLVEDHNNINNMLNNEYCHPSSTTSTNNKRQRLQQQEDIAKPSSMMRFEEDQKLDASHVQAKASSSDSTMLRGLDNRNNLLTYPPSIQGSNNAHRNAGLTEHSISSLASGLGGGPNNVVPLNTASSVAVAGSHGSRDDGYEGMSSASALVVRSSVNPPPTSSSSSKREQTPTSSFSPTFPSTGSSPGGDGGNTSLELTEYQTNLWDLRFSELCTYRTKYGNCLVPHNLSENLPLAKWVKRQRYQYKLKKDGKHSTLTDERQAALDDLNFIWDSHNAVWEERLSELIAFKEVHGHCNVPSTYTKNHSLSVWVQCQRRHYKQYMESKRNNNGGEESSNNKTSTSSTNTSRSRMSEERVQRLESIGFVWKPRIGRND